MTRRTLRRAGTAGTLALAIPAAALAAQPTANGNYQQLKGNREVISLHVDKTGKKIDGVSAYTKCNPVPFNPPITMKITKAGAFALTGERKDVTGKLVKVVISGKFVSATEAKGSYRMSVDKGAKRCNTSAVKFDAKFTSTNGNSTL